LRSRPEGGTSRRERVFVALGSNLGNRAEHLRAAREALAALPRTTVLAASTVEETAPLGGKDQPAYLNQMVMLETALEPRALLTALQSIEHEQGRRRTERWGSRTLDLDIVRFGDRQLQERDLIIPHPELSNRDFWRRELAEIESHER
jgi:2-amino-4-hydroxy-6-hydroxymethyldihydropteridine diphosphokinase